MGLFDKFRRRVREVASDVDEQALSADANSVEAKELLNTPKEPSKPTEDWDDLEAIEATEEVAQTTSSPDEDWDEWDDDEPTAPIVLTKKERKFLERQEKERKKKAAKVAKDMKKRGAVDVARPRGSKVDLTMMRTTTGRQLVKVKQDPKGSSKTAKLETEAGTTLDIELGGGVVNEGGRIIKPSAALDNLLEELEWVLLESDISQHATSALISSLRTALIGSRLRKGAELPKVLEAALKRALHCLLEAGYWEIGRAHV